MFGRQRGGRVVCACFACSCRAQFFDRPPNVVYIQHYQRRVVFLKHCVANKPQRCSQQGGTNAAGAPSVATGHWREESNRPRGFRRGRTLRDNQPSYRFALHPR